jgi:hypothetical protein
MQTLKEKVIPLPAIDACSYCGKAGKCNPQRRGARRRIGTSWQVVCNGCRCRGPLVPDDPHAAVRCWNHLHAERPWPSPAI